MKARILVVDAESQVLKTVTRILERAGYAVVSAASGEAAVARKVDCRAKDAAAHMKAP